MLGSVQPLDGKIVAFFGLALEQNFLGDGLHGLSLRKSPVKTGLRRF